MTTEIEQHDEDLLKEKEAADYLLNEPNTLAVWRCTGRHSLPFVRIGKSIRYRRGDLRKFVASRVVEG